MLIIAGEVRFANAEALKKGQAAYASMIAASRAEEGCVSYSYGQSVTDPDTLVILERWRDQAAVDLHFATPHMAAFLAALGELSIEDFNVNRYDAEDLGPLG